jgi:hypothetical protein
MLIQIVFNVGFQNSDDSSAQQGGDLGYWSKPNGKTI